MYHRALDIIDGIMTILLRSHSREISQKTASKRIARAGRIDYLLQWIRRYTEISTICTKEQRAIAAQFHNHILQTHIQQLTCTGHYTGLIGILTNLLLAHQQHIHALDDLG